MFFFPIRTDRRLETTPWLNYALIAANVFIFVATMQQVNQASQALTRIHVISYQVQEINAQQRATPIPRPDLQYQAQRLLREQQGIEQQLAQNTAWQYHLQPQDPHLPQFVSYAFLHANWMHLIGNMVFLFIFGNGVEDRLGKLGYALFYLAGCVLSGLGHMLMSQSPVLGASGAVAAVTGAYLALFPLSNVTIVYWFWFIGAFEVSSMILILFRVGQDFVFYLASIGNVAYMAHLAGYGFGFVVGMGLLMGRLLPREPYDMLALLEQKRRRASFQRMTRRGFQPWDSASRKPSHKGSKAPDAKPAASPQEQAIMERRGKISEALAADDLPAAARRYVELIEDHPGQVMSQQVQLDLANQLMAEGWYDKAAAAYELFLKAYAAYPQREQVQLILGLIYARYLDRSDRAESLLKEALPRLQGDDKQLAQTVLGEVE